MLHDNWLDIPCIVIFHFFASNLEWLVTKIPKGIFSPLYFYSHFTRALQQKVKAHVIFRKCLFGGQKLVLEKPSNYALSWWIGFPSNTNLCVPISRFMPTHNEICNIYDKHTRLWLPFLKFYEQEVWGGWKSREW